ncbi:MAG: transglutaminase family protein [Planctomycetia bacterium]|nr:transglutaminase family protein [Planctomycetia bacterium]
MSIRVALRHVTSYRYDRPVSLGPQTVRLRPAPHSRTPIASYSLTILPKTHFINWQQDPFGNYLARLVIPDKTSQFRVEIDLTADLTVINPFDFFIDESATEFPFEYEPGLEKDLAPFLECSPGGPRFQAYLGAIDRRPRRTIDFLVDLNQALQRDIRYLIRMEPGVQSPDETLALGRGSCRDSAWLLVQLLRHCGMAARFVSGYLVQLTADVPSLDGPSGPSADFTDLHAWCEVYLAGAGWIGLDATSGLLTGEGHIPLAATPDPISAAPIAGAVDACETTFECEMSVTRVHEDPRVTKPYTDRQWESIDRLGQLVDDRLRKNDVRLTMGGEPTFVSIDDMEGDEWNTSAVGVAKQHLSGRLLRRLRDRFAPGGLLHYGQGKWYPGEPLPRWAYCCLWRVDGEPIWTNPELLADPYVEGTAEAETAGEFLGELADRLGVDGDHIRPAHEDVWHTIAQERRLPVDVDVHKFDVDADEDRRRLASILERGMSRPVGYVLPLTRAWWQGKARWASGPWPVRSERLFLVPGDSPIGLRLPMESLPAAVRGDGLVIPLDPFAERHPLPGYEEIRRRSRSRAPLRAPVQAEIQSQPRGPAGDVSRRRPGENGDDAHDAPPSIALVPLVDVRTALCVESRGGRLHVFMPPVGTLEDYLELVSTIESLAKARQQPVIIEGYLPPPDHRLDFLKVTPDPGVIEVNVHPSRSWTELVETTTGLYDDARLCRLGTEKFQRDGRHTGTGGGNHIVLGGPTPADSPFLRRPDLLRSFLAYWNNHPSLSYLFSSQFIGPTSQAPRVDEGRRDALYELETAFRQIPERGHIPPWLVDRVFRNFLVDLTGNTHRAEFCIDKLYSPDHSSGRLGLVELRGFEMPPHARMSLAQQLLVRALAAWFWERPYREPLIRWGTGLHDRFLLPQPVQSDLREVLRDLRGAGFEFADEWFAPHFEFRFPVLGAVHYDGMTLELRTAIEPWYVLGEEPAGGATTRFVDSSVERLQVLLTGMTSPRYTVACNGRPVPLRPAGTASELVAGVRYRAWQPPSCLHPTLPVHTPLAFDLVDLWGERSIGGCRYHVDHPGGLNSPTIPINALEAECRRAARFHPNGHTGGHVRVRPEPPDPEFPMTLDLRRAPL